MLNPKTLLRRFLVSCLTVIFILPLFIKSFIQAEEALCCSQGMNVRPVLLDDGWGIMRNDGAILTKEFYGSCDEFIDNIAVCSAQTTGWVYLSPEGQTVLRSDRFIARNFSEGLAAAMTKEGLWGYIDMKGEWRISPKFSTALEFHEGLAAVEFNDHWFYIDRKGEYTIDPSSRDFQSAFLGPFWSGVARVVGDNTTGLIGRSGNWIVHPGKLSIEDDFKYGLAPASMGGKFGYVDTKGEWVVKPQFSFALPFTDELAAVYIGQDNKRKAGYINTKGDWIIAAEFDATRRFCSGLAPVRIKDKWGYIDKKGDWVIRPTYEDASIFNAGIASVYFRDEAEKLRHAYINTKGEILYRSAKEFSIITVD